MPEPPSDLPGYVTEPLQRQDLETLRTVRKFVDELIAAREAAAQRELEEDGLADDGEAVVDVEETNQGTKVVKKVPCGKDSCSACPHGPYEYRVHRRGEKLEWEYVGTVDG